MGSDHGQPADLLRAARALAAVAPHSRFFHIVSLLERLTAEAPRVGGEGPPAEERLRFRHDPSLGFPAGDVESAAAHGGERAGEGLRFELTTAFFGLTGVASPLPLHIPEEVLHESDGTPVRRDFLDIFHHRLLSLLYRAVSRYSPPREHRSDGRDVWLARALALAALDLGGHRVAPRLGDAQLLRLVPLLARRGRGAQTLEKALRVVLRDVAGEDAPVRVVEVRGNWHALDADQTTALGVRNHRLGTMVLGQRAYDPAGQVRVRVGPVGAGAHAAFAPGGEGMAAIEEVARLVVREPIELSVELVTRTAMEPMQLGRRGRLGVDSHLRAVRQERVVALGRPRAAPPA